MNTWHLSYILKFFITNTRDRIFFDCQFLTLQTFYIAAGIQFLCWWRYCEFSLRYIPNINTIFIIIYTVESSFFVGDQFLWLSWYPLPMKHITNIFLVFIEFMLNFLPTNYVPTNQAKIGYPRTLTHTNKNKSTVFMWKVFNPLKYNSCLQEFCGYIPFFVCEGYLLCLFAFRLVFQLYLCIADKNKKVYTVMCCYRQMKNTYASMTLPNV